MRVIGGRGKDWKSWTGNNSKPDQNIWARGGGGVAVGRLGGGGRENGLCAEACSPREGYEL